MAVVMADEKTTLTLKVEVGSGDDVTYKNRNFNYIAPNTTNENLYNSATVMGGWQSHTLSDVIRTDKFSLRNE